MLSKEKTKEEVREKGTHTYGGDWSREKNPARGKDVIPSIEKKQLEKTFRQFCHIKGKRGEKGKRKEGKKKRREKISISFGGRLG